MRHFKGRKLFPGCKIYQVLQSLAKALFFPKLGLRMLSRDWFFLPLLLTRSDPC